MSGNRHIINIINNTGFEVNGVWKVRQLRTVLDKSGLKCLIIDWGQGVK